jgi:hypothetical protein
MMILVGCENKKLWDNLPDISLQEVKSSIKKRLSDYHRLT